MKKIIVIIGVTFLFGLVIFYFTFIFGWMSFRRNKDTPEKYLSYIVVRKQVYTKDKAEISKKFRYQVDKHIDFFYSEVFDDDTQIIIDTILYSPDFNKVAIFVLTKNSTSKKLAPDVNSDWYYDGSCYLGTRQKDTFSLSWIGPSFDNSPDKTKLIDQVHEYYFRLYATEKDPKDRYRYNLNDIRFWNAPIWKEQEDKKQREKEFQEFKKKHPEDVYEPKQ
ncbi:MAG TPA: hypothetical protein DCO83_11460 [Mucilaginibacter sp.]|jgi:hypothetical protein|nr:hypothetical protein [Mucilaginibacter sp.]